MNSLSRRELAFLVLLSAMVTGWIWDHARIAGLHRRTAESEQYFRERLSECLGQSLDGAQRPLPASAP
jgi:hypothetical protein